MIQLANQQNVNKNRHDWKPGKARHHHRKRCTVHWLPSKEHHGDHDEKTTYTTAKECPPLPTQECLQYDSESDGEA